MLLLLFFAVVAGVVQLRQSPAKSVGRQVVCDRVAYLFSDCILLLKRQQQQRWTVGSAGGVVASAVALISSTAASGLGSISAASNNSTPAGVIGGGGGGYCPVGGGTAGDAAGTGAPSLVLKKGVPLVHFHLIDLGMQVNPENGGKPFDLDEFSDRTQGCLPISLRYFTDSLFLFELEYWRDVTMVVRRLSSSASSSSSKCHYHHHHHQSASTSGVAPVAYSTASLPKQGSATSLAMLTSVGPTPPQEGVRALPGSSTTLNALTDECCCCCCCEGATEAMADSSGPAKRIVFCLKSADEKSDWLGTLAGIQRKRCATLVFCLLLL